MRDAVARVLERAAASRPSLAIGFLVESGRLRSGWATAFSLQRVPRICRGRDVESPTGPGAVLLSAAILHGTDYPNVKFSSDKLAQGLDGARGVAAERRISFFPALIGGTESKTDDFK